MAVAEGQLMRASDVLELSFFPVGSVLAIYGVVKNTATGCEVNGQPLPNWYICDEKNGTPNLMDKFIAGTDTGERGNDGAETVELTEAHLPAHTHTVTVSSIGSSSHLHKIPVDRFDDYNFNGARTGGNENGDHASGRPGQAWCYGISGSSWQYDSRKVNTSTALIPSHSHTISGSIDSEKTAVLALLPAYYALVFIRKCA